LPDGDEMVVVVDGAEGRDGGVAPAVVEDQLSAAVEEGLQVGVGGVQIVGGDAVGVCVGLIDRGSLDVEAGLRLAFCGRVDHIGEVSRRESEGNRTLIRD